MSTEGSENASWNDPNVLCCIDFKDSVASANDVANRVLQGMVREESTSYSMIQRQDLAMMIADRELAHRSYPLAKLSFPANRNAFRFQAGDLFRFNYAPYGITGMVFRIVSITEENMNTEVIKIDAIEDPYYLSNAVNFGTDRLPYPTPGNTYLPPDYGQPVLSLTNVTIIEAPYSILGGEGMAIIPIVTRETEYEIGYYVYESLDGGNSYTMIRSSTSFAVNGTLASNYPAETSEIDDTIGFYVDFYNADVSRITSITRDRLLQYTNLSLLGDEAITFQNIVPVEGYENRYYLSGIYRSRGDTLQVAHTIGEDFYFVGPTGAVPITVSAAVGSTRYYKIVPYSSRSAGDIANAMPISITFDGRAYAPYSPTNLVANGMAENPTYTSDIVLTWDPRVRLGGAGDGNPDMVTDAAPTWEGEFLVEVRVGGTLVRTATAINDDTWTYTSTMNTTDNGSLASSVTFTLINYIEDQYLPGIQYESLPITITVVQE